MKYIKKEKQKIIEAPIFLEKDGMKILGYNKQSNETMLIADGYIKYSGTKSLANLNIIDGEIIEKAIEPNIQEYDNVIEEKLREVRFERGYTVREPIAYISSSNARWKQDAQDWVDYVDKMMAYGLEVQNNYIQTGIIPTLEYFKNSLPEITWNFKESI